MKNTVICINCEEEIDENESLTDKQAQFPELVLKAEEQDQDNVHLCPNCYKKYTDKSDENLQNELSDVRKFL